MKLQLMLASVMNRFLGDNAFENAANKNDSYANAPEWVKNFLAPIFGILEWLLPVLMILIGVAGIIFIILVAVKFAKSENADQREAEKKRLINIAVAVVVMVIAILLIFVAPNLLVNILTSTIGG